MPPSDINDRLRRVEDRTLLLARDEESRKDADARRDREIADLKERNSVLEKNLFAAKAISRFTQIVVAIVTAVAGYFAGKHT